MKKVLIKFIGIKKCKTYIKILDNNMNTICDTSINNNKIEIYLKEENSYLLIARNKNVIIRKVIYISNQTNKFIFSFYSRIITFLLKDYYYNLPIQKGELILCQK